MYTRFVLFSFRQEDIVSEIMEKLGLSRSADTLVGDLKTPGE